MDRVQWKDMLCRHRLLRPCRKNPWHCVAVWEAVSGIWMTRRWNDELLHPQKQGESQWPHYLQQATKAGLFTWGEGCARNKDISFEMSVSSLWPRPYVSETGQHARAAAAVKKTFSVEISVSPLWR